MSSSKRKTITVSFILISLTARERDRQTILEVDAVQRHAPRLFTDTTQAQRVNVLNGPALDNRPVICM